MNAWRSAVVYRQFIDVDLHPWPTVEWRLSRPLELYGVRRAAMNAEFCRSHVTHWPNIHSPSRHGFGPGSMISKFGSSPPVPKWIMMQYPAKHNRPPGKH